jgi:homoserine dehydrogenase
MTVAHHPRREAARSPRRWPAAEIRIGLLGLGVVGSAVAALARALPSGIDRTCVVTSALVRDPGSRPRRVSVPLTTDPADVFASRPDVIVEVLGGLEPARRLVLEAIARGVPVVTANKSLLAHHGDEIFAAAEAAGVPVRYEASVIAGVPFLDTLARRPLAASIVSLTGIVNGTTNYMLSHMAEAGAGYGEALAGAQSRGFAEPDPSRDVEGVDAAEKLTILLRQLAGCRVAPGAIETTGIGGVTARDIAHAARLDGTIKPVVHAAWPDGTVEAFVGPAFVPASHPLAGLRNATNGICLRDRAGHEICFSGPGAGPDPTAVTILDDVLDAVDGPVRRARYARPTSQARDLTSSARLETSATPWLVGVSSNARVPSLDDFTRLLTSFTIRVRRATPIDASDGRAHQHILVDSCTRARATTALAALSAATGVATSLLRALDREQPA